jgi:tRNA/rRNA methyltransferase
MTDNAPHVILVNPQMGENIGAAARAMRNCGLENLHLVNPRDGWPDERATAMAAGALSAMPPVQVHDNLNQALSGFHYAYATTARPRDQVKPVFTPEGAAADIHKRSAKGGASALIFGAERAGLTNDEIAMASAVITIPLNPDFSSLNLGQAVLLTGYAWYSHNRHVPDAKLRKGENVPYARHDELEAFLDRLEDALETNHFFRNADMRPSMRRNLRNIFSRTELTSQEVRTLHGVLTALLGQKPPRPKQSDNHEG